MVEEIEGAIRPSTPIRLSCADSNGPSSATATLAPKTRGVAALLLPRPTRPPRYCSTCGRGTVWLLPGPPSRSFNVFHGRTWKSWLHPLFEISRRRAKYFPFFFQFFIFNGARATRTIQIKYDKLINLSDHVALKTIDKSKLMFHKWFYRRENCIDAKLR